MAWRIIVCIIAGILLGSLNGAIVVSKTFLNDDVREKGSGNAGLTNFIRNFGGRLTLLLVVIDMGKVVLACYVGKLLLPGMDANLAKMIGGASAQLGHIFPVFYGLRGGKGILSSAALALIMHWLIFVIGFSLFLIIVFTTRYVSLGSMLASLVYAVMFVLLFWSTPMVWALALVMVALAVFMHRENIDRLLHGTEHKFSLSKSKK
ncbi:MAG: glycerol-3-phosphate acyltransferase [Oscillospiraceae bacterium]|jgi:glycerol-3-phosphate acyltransferase PlsY|nr:glycerol-3-phosphate acyltransferase [Oscillospiraceae bacterium]